jgi:hypothetical protein
MTNAIKMLLQMQSGLLQIESTLWVDRVYQENLSVAKWKFWSSQIRRLSVTLLYNMNWVVGTDIDSDIKRSYSSTLVSKMDYSLGFRDIRY